MKTDIMLGLNPLELEARLVPSSFEWDGGAPPGPDQQKMSNAKNWVGDIAPSPNDTSVDLYFPSLSSPFAVRTVENDIGDVIDSIEVSNDKYVFIQTNRTDLRQLSVNNANVTLFGEFQNVEVSSTSSSTLVAPFNPSNFSQSSDISGLVTIRGTGLVDTQSLSGSGSILLDEDASLNPKGTTKRGVISTAPTPNTKFSFNNSSTLQIGLSPTDSDSIVSFGKVEIFGGASLSLVIDSSLGSIPIGKKFIIADCKHLSNPIEGHFNNMPEGAIIADSQNRQFFRISYVDGTGNDISVTAVSSLAPSGLIAAAGNAVVNLNWSAVPSTSEYRVYRSTTPGSNSSVPYQVVNNNWFADFAVQNGSKYYYRVSSVVSNVESPKTSEKTATPQGVAALLPSKQIGVAGDLGSNRAILFGPNGVELFAVEPFSGHFGVRTATGEFTGDGIADLVVGTGPGGPTQVKIFNGASKAEIFSIAPFEAAFTGGVYVAVGDLNGDGIFELVITPDEGGGPRIRVINGKDFTQIADFFGIDDPNFRGGARAAIGDINGDLKGDLVVAAGFGGGPRVAAFHGAQLTSNGGPKLFNDFFAFEQTLRNGIFVAAGDVNGDGFADLVAGGGPGGGPRVYILDGKSLVQNGSGNLVPLGNFFAGNVNNRGGIRVAVKNLDNDIRADIVTGAGTGAGSRVIAYRGTNITPTGGTPPPLLDFDAFPGFSGGVFVG